MNADAIVVTLESSELPLEIKAVPEQNVIEELTPNGPDEPFDEGMRQRNVGHGFDLIDVQNSEIHLPPMEFKQRMMVGADA